MGETMCTRMYMTERGGTFGLAAASVRNCGSVLAHILHELTFFFFSLRNTCKQALALLFYVGSKRG